MLSDNIHMQWQWSEKKSIFVLDINTKIIVSLNFPLDFVRSDFVCAILFFVRALRFFYVVFFIAADPYEIEKNEDEGEIWTMQIEMKSYFKVDCVQR